MTQNVDAERLLLDAARTLSRRDAELLLAAAAGMSRGQWLARADTGIPPEVAARFAGFVLRRAGGVPVAYLLGRREFWSLDLEVSPSVLVPRPETELLVERTLERVVADSASVADLGTGSGAIAIALAHERPRWRIVATDVSDAALEMAHRNVERLVPGRIDLRRGAWFEPLSGQRFAAIVSNPPYIAGDDPVLTDDGLRHEPRGALTPEGDGFAALATLINESPSHLDRHGWLLLEHGAAQGELVRSALVARGFSHVTSQRDLAGHERVTEAQWPS